MHYQRQVFNNVFKEIKIYTTNFAFFFLIFKGGTSGIYCSYTLNLAAHFQILQQIANETEFEEFVIYHRKLIQTTRKLSKIYRPILFVEYTSIAISICFTGIQILLLDDFLQILTSIIHSLTALTDIFIYAYGAQRVLDSALEVFDYFEKNDKRYLVPIMISQRELTFDARVFNVSMYTFSALLSRSSSFITLLKSFV